MGVPGRGGGDSSGHCPCTAGAPIPPPRESFCLPPLLKSGDEGQKAPACRTSRMVLGPGPPAQLPVASTHA